MSDFEETLNKVREQLKAKGARSIRGLERMFKQMDSFDGNRKLDMDELYQGLTDFGCDVNKDEVRTLMAKFDEDCSGNLTFDEFLIGIRGIMPEARLEMVNAAFTKFDVDGCGAVTMKDLREGHYNVDSHPKFISGEMTEEQIFLEFLNAFGDKDGDGSITPEEFQDYYRNVSAHCDTDEEFKVILTNAWKL